jgi:hypothetical protein
MKLLLALALALSASATSVAAADRDIVEPKKIKSVRDLRAGEGAVQLSVRTQMQFIETLIVYFVEVRPDGSDGSKVFRFERGAGVPVMGSNMIDQKQQTYRLPAGRYRPLGFTVACNQMPYREGLVCTKGFAEFPTGFYASGEPVFEVAAGQMTTAGDFIVEYTGPIPPAGTSLFDVDAEPHQWQLRWREGEQALQGFEMLTLNRPSVPEEWRSRITCNRRPEGVTLYIPFAC